MFLMLLPGAQGQTQVNPLPGMEAGQEAVTLLQVIPP